MKRWPWLSIFFVLGVLVVSWFAFATTAEMYFATDKAGQNRITDIQEGDTIWICVYDPDEDIDCDVRDKVWTDIKVMDPKTGAYIVWVSYPPPPFAGPFYGTLGYVPYQGHDPGTPGDLRYDYLEETGTSTGLFVSARPFQVGTRENLAMQQRHTHVVDNNLHPDPAGYGFIGLQDFQFGHYEYLAGGLRSWWTGTLATPFGAMPWPLLATPALPAVGGDEGSYLVGRFENMDGLIGLYLDQNDPGDVACAMAKIIDTESSCSWDQQIYGDCNASATITIADADENLDCNAVESVPVFVLVNPGSWNPVDFVAGPPPAGGISPTTFCDLKRRGGVSPIVGLGGPGTGVGAPAPILGWGFWWWNIYNSGQPAPVPADLTNNQVPLAGAYYIEYPTVIDVNPNVTTFDTTDLNGIVRCSFYAVETGANTGVFQLNFNHLCNDLGFNGLNEGDVLVAYYLDPNDEDDFTLCTAYIENRNCQSSAVFTDADRMDRELFWIGRDPVYVQVIDGEANLDSCCPEQVVVHICDPHRDDDSEWILLDETSVDSPVFFTNNGYALLPVWDALGVGIAARTFQLTLDNWTLEVYNEDDVYARYNNVAYAAGVTGVAGLGDLTPFSTALTAFPPQVVSVRKAGDVAFDTVDIGDTQVFQFGGTTEMWFLDRNANRIGSYLLSECVYIEVHDPDQNEDQHRRERITAYWDYFGGQRTLGQNWPFGPSNLAPGVHPIIIPGAVAPSTINNLLGTVNIFAPGTGGAPTVPAFGTNEYAKLYILNPRTGFWAAVDLMETGVDTGHFVSTICIDLASQYAGVPTLGVIPEDTLIGVYQDPSNHSDSAWICSKVATCAWVPWPTWAYFTDAEGKSVSYYTDEDDVYVKVVDSSRAGATSLTDAVEIEGQRFDLYPLTGAPDDTFITDAIPLASLGVGVGDTITATYTYTDPMAGLVTETDTVTIVLSELDVEKFIAVPNPFEDEVTFTYEGSGLATTFSVAVYDLAGKLLWSEELANVDEVTWDGVNGDGEAVASGVYIYVIVASDEGNTFTGKGLFVKNL